jgi:topoisomerase-4 subunit A
MSPPRKAPAAKKAAPARKAPVAKKPAAKAAAMKKPAAPVKVAMKKAVPAKAVGKKVPVKKSAVKKAAPVKAAVKKTVSKQSVSKKRAAQRRTAASSTGAATRNGAMVRGPAKARTPAYAGQEDLFASTQEENELESTQVSDQEQTQQDLLSAADAASAGDEGGHAGGDAGGADAGAAMSASAGADGSDGSSGLPPAGGAGGAGGGGDGGQPPSGGSLPPIPGDADYLPLALYAERAYLDYAVSVVKGRALPDVTDGQKPVQRRIIYAMNEMGLGPTAKPVKSARVVGEVLGKYHPHGDQSAYDAMVRLAQSFSMRYPLVDGQGNFGSRDGDNAAAMRYTEARLTPISRLLLDEIDMGTVDFMPNYDGQEKEPKQMPARLPMVLLNGASGIAVGMATEIPPHNLREVAKAAVAMVRKPKITTAELMEHITGPDFPGGGQIISSQKEIQDAYESGRGSIKVRARWKIEELARGQWQVVVHELPPSTSTQKVLEEIEELTNPKVRPGKKALSTEQQNLKALILSVLDRVTDESGKDAPVRLVLEPKTSKIDQQEFMTTLLAHTSMESSAPLNMVMIGNDGRPRQKSLRDVLAEWVDFRFITVRRRTEFRLGKVDARIHILEGRLIVYLNIDKVIKVIRESDDPKADLMAKFKLTEIQAEDILEIRLRQLARMEGIKLERDLEELRVEKKDLEHLLADDGSMKKLVIKEIELDAKTYGDDRRTVIEEAGRSVVTQAVVDEPVTVIFSGKGWVRARSGHGHDHSLFNFKEGDGFYGAFECRTVDNAVLIGSNGRAYSIPVAQLPGARGDGVPVTTLIDLEAGTRIVHMLAGPAEQAVLVASSASYGFVCKIGDMLSRVKGGKSFMKLGEKDEPLRPALIAAGHERVVTITEKKRLLAFALEEVNTLSGGRGVILQELELRDRLKAVAVVGQAGVVIEGEGNTGREYNITYAGRDLATFVSKRARKGKLVTDRIGDVAGLSPVKPAA